MPAQMDDGWTTSTPEAVGLDSQLLSGVMHWLDSLHRSNMPTSAPTGRRSTPNLSSYAVRGAAKIFREKVTGAHSDQRELLKMLHALAPGDVVTVTRVDRLARSAFDLFAIVKQIVDAKAQFRSLAEPWADTGTSTGRLMIAVLGGLADVERDLIRTRTAEGRSRAQKRGQHMGRPSKLTDAQKAEARRRRAQGATLVELARSYGVGKSTISRLTP
jgi:DNA invertase Pin-like site-specific DNA recombinase